ncbi:nuclease-related domain-containing protein [Amnibacterium sp.]|uniref:nuclease-related domain-containing protein n=1 Tax=Amnibacterium sp. TaxID=1872496 RepID=UPI00345DD7DC
MVRTIASDAAGRSSQREYDRRRSAREARVRSRFPRIGGLLLALVDEPASTKAWAKGAEGERAVADRLGRLEGIRVLHDRRMRRPDGRLSSANIDHIVIAPSGVWVVDSKAYRGRAEVRRHGGLFTPRVEELWVGGRNRTRLIDGVARQVEAVRADLAGWPSVPVRGALCFVGTELPWIDQDVAGLAIRGRRGLVRMLRRPGPLDAMTRDRIAARLDRAFPPH